MLVCSTIWVLVSAKVRPPIVVWIAEGKDLSAVRAFIEHNFPAPSIIAQRSNVRSR
jgi:hypothetical protein